MKKRWIYIGAIVLCVGVACVVSYLMLHTSGPDSTKMQVIYIAFLLLLLHGCYRSLYHLLGNDDNEVDEIERHAREATGAMGVVSGFLNPKTMRFRTMLSLVILVVAYQLSSPIVFWVLLGVFVIFKGLMLWQLLRYSKAYNRLADEELEAQMLADDVAYFEQVDQLIDSLKDYHRDSIHLSIVPEKGVELPIGCSKFGGRPDVVPDFVWPQDDSHRPLSLLLQIDCADIAPHDHEQLLPRSGRLYFFYELEQMDWDNEHHAVRVIYDNTSVEHLHRAPYPDGLSEANRLQEYSLEFSLHRSLPDWAEFDFDAIGDRFTEDMYFEACERFNAFDECNGSMLGHAAIIQNPICDNLIDNVLLLQLFSLEDPDLQELNFCDCGTIYFYISREDLKSHRFDRVTFQLQCY